MFLPKYSIVYINEKSQAAIIFNNVVRYLVHDRVTSKDYIFFGKVLDVHSINMGEFVNQFKLVDYTTVS